MKRVGAALLVALLLGLLSPAGAVSSPDDILGYSEQCKLTYTINSDRTLQVAENLTFVNTSEGQNVKISENRIIPGSNVENVQVLDDAGDLNPQLSSVGENTLLSFSTNWISPDQHYNYSISYTAGGMVDGTGVEYRVGLAGRTANDFRYDNYVVELRGPPGSYFFASDQQVEQVENDPPTIRYTTSIAINDNFEGLRARFYDQPAYYKVTLKYPFTNSGSSSTTNLDLDVMLFNSEIPWQFSALASSSHSIQTMWVDNENNWHGGFRINELAPGETENIQLNLLYEVQLYDPSISAGDVGTISEVPATLQGYLGQDDYWESENAALQQAADVAIGGETRAYLAAEKISEYVVDRLNYQEQDERRGAFWAYTNQTGDCSEYTDLSIALARASGIPARALYGWGYYEEENLRGHAWLEYYFPGVGWQPADPTWDESYKAYFAKLDPIHLTQIVRGLDSSESDRSYTYYGAQPTSGEREATITLLTTAQAAQEYVNAAQYAVNLADTLLKSSPNEALQAEQDLAKQALEQAQAATDENQIILNAKNSLQSANEVIGTLGEKPAPPTQPGGISVDVEKMLPYLVVAGVIIGVALAAYAISRRRGKR